MTYKEVLEKVVQYFSEQPRYLNEFILAKDYFFEKTGRVFEDEPAYEQRMVAFTEWFTLDRPLARIGVTPIRLYQELFSHQLGEAEAAMVNSLVHGIHSVFRFKEKKPQCITVQDLFDNTWCEVFERREYVGFEDGSVFEGRIIKVQGQMMFTETYYLHPIETSGLIQKQIKLLHLKNRHDFLPFIFQLASMRLKCDRYHKVDVARIYNFNHPEAFQLQIKEKRAPLASAQARESR